jgi:hypothetical protein
MSAKCNRRNVAPLIFSGQYQKESISPIQTKALMSTMTSENDHDYPSATLSSAEGLFTEMLRQIQEERVADVSFFNAMVGEAGIAFSVAAFGGGEVLANVTGERAMQEDHGLNKESRGRLTRRGWTLPEESGTDVTFPTLRWDGVTSQADRRHLAQEMLSVATEIYGIQRDQKIRFQLRLDGTPGPSQVG